MSKGASKQNPASSATFSFSFERPREELFSQPSGVAGLLEALKKQKIVPSSNLYLSIGKRRDHLQSDSKKTMPVAEFFIKMKWWKTIIWLKSKVVDLRKHETGGKT